MSWWHLDSTIQEQAAYEDYYKGIEVMACPNDGEPMRIGPPQQPGVWFCPFDGWQFPRDFDPATQSGM